MTKRLLSRSLLAIGLVATLAQPGVDAAPVERLSDGILVPIRDGFLRVQFKTDAIVRVLFSAVRDPRVDDLVVVGPDTSARLAAMNPFDSASATAAAKESAPQWTLETTDQNAVLKSARLRVTVDLASGGVTFQDEQGRPILAEASGTRRLTPANVAGESTFNVRQAWVANQGEALYGLGQRQEGKLDLKGYDLDLWQRNTVVGVPFLVSSRGYGILWDNTSFTRFGDIRPFEPIPPSALRDANGKPGGLTTGVLVDGRDPLRDLAITPTIALGADAGTPPAAAGGDQSERSVRVWHGDIVAPATGVYQFQTYSNLDIKVWLDGQLRIDHWKQNWATENDQFKVHLEGGKRYPVRVTASPGATLRFLWKTPAPSADTSLWSEVGEAVDYYFVYGPEIDAVVTGYRTLTGEATLLPRWAYGFWQSRNKYETQAEVLGTLAEFRRRQIPIDNIVQDWQYWKADAWGSHQFDEARFPDPDAMIRTIHDSHARFMISVWGKFYPQVENAKALQAIDGLYEMPLREGTQDWLQHNYTFYDAFNAPARKMFWTQVNSALFSKGVDAWWMDATEPDIVQPSPPTLELLRHFIDTTAKGPASRVINAYPLVNSEAVYDGQRSAAPDQRVFILTRSGFAGIQRYATVTWSGDITSEWTTLRKQITAGLGFSVSGTPYWTSDTGGYTMQNRFAKAREGEDLEEWRELNSRWFQFSTFCPILRVHGADRPREMWNIGDDDTPVYRSQLQFDRLRYALFPYIYSLAADVTHQGYTMMRPLVMDFRTDTNALDVADQYMFGPAFLVNPVTEFKARSRPVYLPAGTAWYDFWTGQQTQGGRTIAADAPYDRIPLFVPAGALIPVGPPQQFIGEQDARSLTVYVYAGADGRFSLYEDDGLTYGYERQQFSRIPLTWDDGGRTLTIGTRAGSFPGMLTERTFNIVLVSADAPAGYRPEATGRTVPYRGDAVTVSF